MLKWGAGTLLRPSQWLLEVTTWINFGEFLRMVKSHIVSCQGVYFKDRNSGLITTSSTDRSIWKQIRIWHPHESFVWLSWTEVLPGQRFEAYLGAWKWVRGQWPELSELHTHAMRARMPEHTHQLQAMAPHPYPAPPSWWVSSSLDLWTLTVREFCANTNEWDGPTPKSLLWGWAWWFALCYT